MKESTELPTHLKSEAKAGVELLAKATKAECQPEFHTKFRNSGASQLTGPESSRKVQPFCYFRGRQRRSCDTNGNAGGYEGGLVLPRTKETRPQADPTSASYASPLPTSLTQGDHPRREERPNALRGAPFLLHLPWHTGPAQQGTS